MSRFSNAFNWINPTTPGGLGFFIPTTPGGFGGSRGSGLFGNVDDILGVTAMAEMAERFSRAMRSGADSMASVTGNLANLTENILPSLMRQGGIIIVVLLIALISFFMITAFGMKGVSKARNNPAALQRLQMMHDHKEKMATQVAQMDTF